jgi:hypothetical protein
MLLMLLTLIYSKYSHMFDINGEIYTITGPIEVISDTQLHVETDKGIILVDDTMEIYYQLK